MEALGPSPLLDEAWLPPKTRYCPTCVTVPNFVAVGEAISV